MFWPDVIELKHFYNSSLGHIVQSRLSRTIKACWPKTTNACILGLGYAIPYLEYLLDPTNHLCGLMPTAQGVMHWPHDQKNVVALSNETSLPFGDNMFQHILVIHALEHTDHVEEMMEECWRVLAPNGRIIFCVPNRQGLWSRSENVPFSYGHPYSLNQMLRLLRHAMFVPLLTRYTLFIPPVQSRLMQNCEGSIEKLGSWLFTPFGGMLIIEAEKQVFGALTERVRKQRFYIPSIEHVALGQ